MKKRVLFLCIVLTMVISGAAFATVDADEKTVVSLVGIGILDWDPGIMSMTEIYSLSSSYERLVRFKKQPGSPLEILPSLATSWEKADDNMSWTFKLRKGVKYHDGETFNALTAKRCIDRTITMDKGAAYIWGPVKEVQVIDDYTIKFVLKYPAGMDLICGSIYGAIMYSPKAAEKGTEWFTQGHEAGTGPYKVEKYENNQQLVLTRFDDYWGGWDGKHFDRIIIKYSTEPTTHVQMLKSGDADISVRVIPNDLMSDLKSTEGIDVISKSSWINHYIYLNTKKFPTDNLKIRQAICYAFDYVAAVNSINAGYAELASGPLPAGIWGANRDLKKYSFNLEKAKQLVEESGIPKNKLKIKMLWGKNITVYTQYGQMLQAALSQIGIGLELEGHSVTALWGLGRNPETATNLFGTIWWANYPSPSEWMFLFATEKKPLFNLSYYSNPAYDKQLKQAVSEEGVDRAKAAETYKKVQKIMVDDAVAIFVGDMKNVIVKRKSLKGYENNPAYPFFQFYDMYRE